ncbi:MAG: hypothetical protein HN732_06085 [Rhodospirillaceae bacterium]|jgi:hypothetical protein|nr:hypothetical protein [Rhodospirillaceae bacterium]
MVRIAIEHRLPTGSINSDVMAIRAGAAKLLFGSLVAVLMFAISDDRAAAQGRHLDAATVIGPDACNECHEEVHAVWRQTRHATGFNRLTRHPITKTIAQALRIDRIKKDSKCLGCHFLTRREGTSRYAADGVVCEACHGAAKLWEPIHSTFLGGARDAHSETPAHRQQRYAAAEAAGWAPPRRLDRLARNCFQCHIVDDEELVNRGRHPNGLQFELLAWTQGNMRHNVDYTTTNVEAPLNRRRVIFLTGQILAIKSILQALGKAREEGPYSRNLTRRKAETIATLRQITQLVLVPEITREITTALTLIDALGGRADPGLATELDQLARKCASDYDGAMLSGLDKLLPGREDYRGEVFNP